MFQGRYPEQGPNFQPPHGPFGQQQRPNFFQRMPQENHPFLQQRPQHPQMGRQSKRNRPFQQQSSNQGLLGKILGRSKQTPQNLFAPPSGMNRETRTSGGILDTLKSPGGLNTMLNNTQRVLQAAEQFTPMIQQYGPIVKNIPSLWKLMRAVNSSDNEKAETEQKESVKKEKPTKQQQDSGTVREKAPKKQERKKQSESVPKLYI